MSRVNLGLSSRERIRSPIAESCAACACVRSTAAASCRRARRPTGWDGSAAVASISRADSAHFARRAPKT
eukprot:5486133-Prorocentrum_lima.AAC.1